jgi:uncharacterized protein (DUF885 family)
MICTAALLLGPRARAAPPRPAVTPAASSPADARLARLVDDFYAEYPRYYPTEATTLGLHQFDGELDDLSAAGITRELGWLQSWQARLIAVDPAQLAADNRFDLQLLLQSLREHLFDRARLQSHRRRPNVYVRLCSRSVNAIIKRDYQTASSRLRSVVQRLDKIPDLLKSAEENLDLMSPVAIDITLRDLDATVRFFRQDVTAAFPGVSDAALQAQLRLSAEAAASALQRYGEFLRRDGRPRARSNFALGAQLFAEKLWADEMIDTPLPELLRRGEAELARLQDDFRATARRIDAKKTTAAVQLDVIKDHPAATAVLRETQARLLGQRRFLIEHDIVTVPSEVLPLVRETPPFLRATSLASMDTPGPFEASTEAYYYITLPEPTRSPAEIEDFLRGAYNRPLIDVVSIHEAYPGHYVQFLWLPRLTKARQFNGVSSNSEGWAHYTEQMMLDQGYGGGDPRLRLAQLQDALLRAARFVAGIRLHTQGMTLSQCEEFFQREGFQSQQVAELETRRGTQDPLYLVYTYGKLEITKLRDAYQAKLGPAFSLRRFHDDFLRYGRAPLKLVAEAMLSPFR